MGYRIGQDIQKLLAGRNPSTLADLAGDVLDTVHLVDRHARSLYMMKTAMHDDPVGVSFQAAVFWYAENWTPWLLSAYADCICLDLVFVRVGKTRNEVHAIGREGPRHVFNATAPYIIRHLRKMSGNGTPNWSTRARLKATRLATLLAECAAMDRDPTFRHKAGRQVLEAKELRKIVRNQYFVDLRQGKHAKARWWWTTLREDPAKLPVDRII